MMSEPGLVISSRRDSSHSSRAGATGTITFSVTTQRWVALYSPMLVCAIRPSVASAQSMVVPTRIDFDLPSKLNGVTVLSRTELVC